MRNTLCRDERLRGEQVISNIFENGQSFFQSPYKVFWIKIVDATMFPCRFGVSAPKRLFKRAVKRNLLKRRSREAFRINKNIISDAIIDGSQVHLMVIYASDKLHTWSEMDESMKKILNRIVQKCSVNRVSKVLSVLYFAAYACFVSIYAYMFAVCVGSAT